MDAEESAADGPVVASTDTPAASPTRSAQKPSSAAFRRFIAQGWAPRPDVLPARSPVAEHAARRRNAVSARFPGERLVIPAGGLRTRSNDTDYRFRPHSAFAHLTGLGTDREPDAVLVLDPLGDTGHEAILFFRPRAERDSREFFADARYGELWVGPRPTLAELEAELGLSARHIDELESVLNAGLDDHPTDDRGQEATGVGLRVVPGADPGVEQAVGSARGADPAERAVDASREAERDAELGEFLSELRLVKDDWEVGQLRDAVAATVTGFERIVSELPHATAAARGERVVEGVFELVAREHGNGVGYETIAAAGDHACTLHWIRNDGPVRDGDLVLIDAGVEVDSLYTADVTRTLPVSGRFTADQREVYDVVLEAADAAFAVARPGSRFRDLHTAAMEVIAARLEQWGLLPGTAAESLGPEGQFHRRWMVHGTSHHLGLDVHDCAQARREMYLDAVLEPGMVFTIEPGLYFQAPDVSVPDRLRGIGIRIEDDVLVTADGCENLSAALPRRADDVEAWMQRLLAAGDR